MSKSELLREIQRVATGEDQVELDDTACLEWINHKILTFFDEELATSRPEWFVCKKCLWWDGKSEISDGYCHNGDLGSVGPEWFCQNFICATCWQPWDEYRYDTENGHINDPQIYTDHNKCKPVRFEP